jgi:antitoxin VapB
MERAVTPERHVKLFKNGRNQAVRIPREFELPGEDAIMRKEGERLIIEPAPPKSLLALLATLVPLDEDFSAIPELAPDPVQLWCATCSIPMPSPTSSATHRAEYSSTSGR